MGHSNKNTITNEGFMLREEDRDLITNYTITNYKQLRINNSELEEICTNKSLV